MSCSPAGQVQNTAGPIPMSDQVFSRFSGFIMTELGIKMPPSKKTLLQGRLQKRLLALGMTSFDQYGDYLFSAEGKARELFRMLDLVTTNKTDFFREPRHYEFLVQTALPDLLERNGAGVDRTLRLWSAGCSTGAEPYTLAMVLCDFGQRVNGFDFSVFATDICTEVLDKGKQGIYREDEVAPVSLPFRRKYLLKSKDRRLRQVRIAPELRVKVAFRKLNFMDAEFGIRTPMDVIFCRNVIIYFDLNTQAAVLKKLCRHLRPGGYLFMGHSETLNDFDLPLRQVTATVYRKK